VVDENIDASKSSNIVHTIPAAAAIAADRLASSFVIGIAGGATGVIIP
jgi:hypothetical protein